MFMLMLWSVLVEVDVILQCQKASCACGAGPCMLWRCIRKMACSNSRMTQMRCSEVQCLLQQGLPFGAFFTPSPLFLSIPVFLLLLAGRLEPCFPSSPHTAGCLQPLSSTCNKYIVHDRLCGADLGFEHLMQGCHLDSLASSNLAHITR